MLHCGHYIYANNIRLLKKVSNLSHKYLLVLLRSKGSPEEFPHGGSLGVPPAIFRPLLETTGTGGGVNKRCELAKVSPDLSLAGVRGHHPA